VVAALATMSSSADSQSRSGAGALGASAQVRFKIVIPETLAFSVTRTGSGQPKLAVGVRVTDNGRHLIPVSLGKTPLVRCAADAAGQTTCTASTP